MKVVFSQPFHSKKNPTTQILTYHLSSSITGGCDSDPISIVGSETVQDNLVLGGVSCEWVLIPGNCTSDSPFRGDLVICFESTSDPLESLKVDQVSCCWFFFNGEWSQEFIRPTKGSLLRVQEGTRDGNSRTKGNHIGVIVLVGVGRGRRDED